jgi:hypothetical protein
MLTAFRYERTVVGRALSVSVGPAVQGQWL